MSARVRVPATSSNLGAGFDCVGIAVDRWLTAAITIDPGGDRVVINRAGRLAALELSPEEDLLTRGFRAACAASGTPLSGGVAIDVESEIPVGCGLGSSAAAIVAGALLADAALGLGLPRERIVEIAADVEGHPDNVAAAVYGGAVLCVRTTDGRAWRSAALRVTPELTFLLAVPPFASDTRAARAALPEMLPHAAAALAASRAAALVQGLATGDGALLAAALEDVLHVPFRRRGIPGYDAVVAAARAAGAYGATLSGAGSAILAIAPRERAGAVGAALLAAWRETGVEAELVRCAPPAGGAEVTHAPRTTHHARGTIHQA
ncbi:MAG TPA: homoserine kinase [Gemmatimonadales bacterium]|jgi:homoserine kinase|nr:homoserine kinase [Gemmatimonadales bacterium]